MSMKTFILTALAYLILTFAFAILWHLVAFRSFHERLRYFGEGERNVALGFLTIAVQGFVLAYIYPFFQRGGSKAWKQSVEAKRGSRAWKQSVEAKRGSKAWTGTDE